MRFYATFGLCAAVIFQSACAPPNSVVYDRQLPGTTLEVNNPKVQLIVYMDLKCSDAKRFMQNVFPLLKSQYIDREKISFTPYAIAYLPGSMPAANAVYCALEQSQNAFYVYLIYLFENQPPEWSDWATVDNLLTMAKAAGLSVDFDQLQICMKESSASFYVEQANAAEKIILNGPQHSPVVLVNGLQVVPAGADPYTSPTFEEVSAAIERAQAS